MSRAAGFAPRVRRRILLTRRTVAAVPARSLRLELAGLARLRVVPLAAEVLQETGALHLLLEGLERPLDAVAFVQRDFDHGCLLVANGLWALASARTIATAKRASARAGPIRSA